MAKGSGTAVAAVVALGATAGIAYALSRRAAGEPTKHLATVSITTNVPSVALGDAIQLIIQTKDQNGDPINVPIHGGLWRPDGSTFTHFTSNTSSGGLTRSITIPAGEAEGTWTAKAGDTLGFDNIFGMVAFNVSQVAPPPPVVTTINVSLDKASVNPGENILATMGALDQNNASIATVLLFVRVKDPQGTIQQSTSMNTSGGSLTVTISVPADALAGTWTVEVSDKNTFS